MVGSGSFRGRVGGHGAVTQTADHVESVMFLDANDALRFRSKCQSYRTCLEAEDACYIRETALVGA